MSRPLTYAEARAARTCARMIAKADYVAHLAHDPAPFVDAVAHSLATLLGISVADARDVLVRQHGAMPEPLT